MGTEEFQMSPVAGSIRLGLHHAVVYEELHLIEHSPIHLASPFHRNGLSSTSQ